MHDKSDKEFVAYLRGDSPLSARYRELADEGPSDAIDAAILDAATARHERSHWPSFATAAVVVLSATIVLLWPRYANEPRTVAPTPAGAESVPGQPNPVADARLQRAEPPAALLPPMATADHDAAASQSPPQVSMPQRRRELAQEQFAAAAKARADEEPRTHVHPALDLLPSGPDPNLEAIVPEMAAEATPLPPGRSLSSDATTESDDPEQVAVAENEPAVARRQVERRASAVATSPADPATGDLETIVVSGTRVVQREAAESELAGHDDTTVDAIETLTVADHTRLKRTPEPDLTDNGDSDTASMLDVSAKLDGIAALWQIGEQDAAVQALQDLLDHRTEDALDRALLEARLPAALLERVTVSLPESPPEK